MNLLMAADNFIFLKSFYKYDKPNPDFVLAKAVG